MTQLEARWIDYNKDDFTEGSEGELEVRLADGAIEVDDSSEEDPVSE